MARLQDATTGEEIAMSTLRVDASGRTVRVLAISPTAVLVHTVDTYGSPVSPARRVPASDIGAIIVP